MKKLLLATLAASSFLASASEPEPHACEFVYNDAYQIMKAHQVGVPSKDIWPIVKGKADLELMFEQAYSLPRFKVEQNQSEEVERFADKWFMLCLQATGEDV